MLLLVGGRAGLSSSSYSIIQLWYEIMTGIASDRREKLDLSTLKGRARIVDWTKVGLRP